MRSNTGTGTTEAHILPGPWYQQFELRTGTPLGVGDSFDFALADYDKDHNADLYAIQRKHTGTGTIEVHVLAAPTPSPPAAPSGLSVIAHTSSSLTFRWTDNATGPHGYQLFRQTGTGLTGWKVVSGQYPYFGSATVTDAEYGLAPASTFCYRVRVYNSVTTLESNSPLVCGTTDPLPANLMIPQGAIWTTELNNPYNDFSFIHAGDAFSISWDECNNGQSSAAAHTSTLLLRATGQSSFSSVGTDQVPALPPGWCYRTSVKLSSGLAADQYDSLVSVDSGNAVVESDKLDNVGSMGFNILQ